MNKAKWILILCLLTSASGQAATSIQIRFEGHGGESKAYNINWSAEKIRINGLDISSHVVPALGPQLTALVNPVNSHAGECQAGQYRHVVMIENKPIREARGCFGSKVSKSLLDSVRKIESLSFLRYQ